MATDTIKLKDLAEETQHAQDLARRYRCEFVDLKETKIDHELFRTVPVDLMFRYHFVPLHAQNGSLLEIALSDPRQIISIDELSVLLSKKLKVKVATYSQIADLLKKTEQSQRVLEEVTEGFTLDVVGDDEKCRRKSEYRSTWLTSDEGNIAPVIKLVDTTIFQRARATRERYTYRDARSGTGDQVPNRRRAAIRDESDCEGVVFGRDLAHQSDERAGYF